jgi:hypothetical protein
VRSITIKFARPGISAALLSRAYSSRKIFLLFLTLIVVQAIDATIGSLADIFKGFSVSLWGVALFVSFSIVYGFAQYSLLSIVKAKNREHEIKRTHFKMLEKAVTAVQYILIAIMAFVVLQVIFASQYYTAVLNIAVIISAGSAVYILGLLAYWFLSWFARTKALVVLLYGLAMAVSAVATIGMVILFNIILLDKQATITPQSEVIYPPPSSWANTFQTISGVASFTLIWAGTVVLMRHNIYRIGRIKFWTLSSTPLIVFSTIYLSLYQVVGGSFPTDDPFGTIVVPILFIIYTGIAAATLIGIAFRSIAKSLSNETSIKDYLLIVSYGFILFFITTLTSISGGYPPFGIINVLLVGPLSFLILTGLYRSAVSVAEDAKLRRLIRDTTKKELDLLYDIGAAETSKEIEKKVMTIMKKNKDILAQQSGVEPSLTEKEVQDLVTMIQNERSTRR